ncbi:MAG: O-antigen ligase family protein [Acidimicrobiales bacterium]
MIVTAGEPHGRRARTSGVEDAHLPLLVSAAVVYQLFVSAIDFGKVGLTSEGVDVLRLSLIGPGQFVLGTALLWSGHLRRALASPQMILLMGWFAWAFATASWSVDPPQTIIQTLGALNLVVTAIWVVERFGATAMARLFTVAVSLVIAVGLPADLFALDLFGGEHERWSGITSATNRLGTLAGLVISMVVVILRSRRSWAAVVMGAIAVVAMIGSGSRAATICTVVAIGIQVVPIIRSRSRQLLAIAVILLGVVLGAGFVTSSSSPTSYTTGRSIDSLTGREAIWAEAIRRVSEAPLAGHGAFAELSLWTESYLRNDVGFEAFHSHNLVLTMLVTTGAVGCSLIVGAVAVTIARAVRTSRSRVVERRVETWRVDSLALLVILVGTGMTEASLDGPSPLFSALGCALALANRDRTLT